MCKFDFLFQERAEKLFLHYLQRWAKDYLRRRLDWVVDDLVNSKHQQLGLTNQIVTSKSILNFYIVSWLTANYNIARQNDTIREITK